MDNRQHIICAEVVIIPDEGTHQQTAVCRVPCAVCRVPCAVANWGLLEPSCPPRGAFASMGGRYCSAPFVPPTSEDGGQAPVESPHPNPPGLRGKVMGALPSLPYGRRVFSVGWHPLWVYALYDARALAQRAKLMFDELILKQKQQPPVLTSSSTSTSTSTSFSSSTADPVSYSFWLAANLPLDDKVRQELLESKYRARVSCVSCVSIDMWRRWDHSTLCGGPVAPRDGDHEDLRHHLLSAMRPRDRRQQRRLLHVPRGTSHHTSVFYSITCALVTLRAFGVRACGIPCRGLSARM
jgi:hypothetical protein